MCEDNTKSVQKQDYPNKKSNYTHFRSIGNKASCFCAFFLFILQIDASKNKHNQYI